MTYVFPRGFLVPSPKQLLTHSKLTCRWTWVVKSYSPFCIIPHNLGGEDSTTRFIILWTSNHQDRYVIFELLHLTSLTRDNAKSVCGQLTTQTKLTAVQRRSSLPPFTMLCYLFRTNDIQSRFVSYGELMRIIPHTDGLVYISFINFGISCGAPLLISLLSSHFSSYLPF